MTTRVKVYKPYLGSGKVYLRDASKAQSPSYEIGNVSELKLAIDEEVIEQKDYTSAGGGTHAEVRRINSVTASMVLHDLNADNLALATRGTTTAVAAGTVTDEAHSAWAGSLVRLEHPAPTSVVVTSTDGATTYTDYEVRPEGIFVLATGDIATAATSAGDAGVTIKVAYSYGAYTNIEALTQGGTTWQVSFGGINEADSNKPVLVDLWKVNLGAASNLSLIGDELGSIPLEGKCLKESSKGGGDSAFFRVQQA